MRRRQRNRGKFNVQAIQWGTTGLDLGIGVSRLDTLIKIQPTTPTGMPPVALGSCVISDVVVDCQGVVAVNTSSSNSWALGLYVAQWDFGGTPPAFTTLFPANIAAAQEEQWLHLQMFGGWVTNKTSTTCSNLSRFGYTYKPAIQIDQGQALISMIMNSGNSADQLEFGSVSIRFRQRWVA